LAFANEGNPSVSEELLIGGDADEKEDSSDFTFGDPVFTL
jgi:hypothetical protein